MKVATGCRRNGKKRPDCRQREKLVHMEFNELFKSWTWKVMERKRWKRQCTRKWTEFGD